MNIHSPGFIARTNTGRDITNEIDLGIHYQGTVSGQANSLVAISVFNNEVMGFIDERESQYTLGKLTDSELGHILYKNSDLNTTYSLDCGMEDDGNPYRPEDLHYTQSRDVGDCVDIYVEAGQSVINAFGGDLTLATNFLNGVFAQSFIVYANEGITMQMSELFVWETPDPYTFGTTGGQLGEFQSQIAVMNGDLGHLVEVQNIGGLAAGFSGICNANIDNSLCFSGFSGTSYNDVPTSSFNVYIITHEMGHLMGSRHTHACVWNGDNTAIDGCSGFTEGACAVPPSPPGGGTIMSYCINDAVGVDFVEGFHPQPQAVMLNTVANATCLSSCAACVLDVNCALITDETLSCRADLPPVDFDLPIIIESCGDVTLSALTIIPGNSGCPGDEITITRTYFIQDEEGNMAQCMQTFTVVSNVAPTIVCPGGGVVECAADISVNAADAVVTSECGTPSVAVSGPVINGTPDCPFTTYTYTYTVTDHCNRMASCDQVFTILNAEPTIVCPADMTVECAADIVVSADNATVTTSCTLGSNTIVTGPVIDGQADCSGTMYTYLYTATDDCGRVAECKQVFYHSK